MKFCSCIVLIIWMRKGMRSNLRFVLCLSVGVILMMEFFIGIFCVLSYVI